MDMFIVVKITLVVTVIVVRVLVYGHESDLASTVSSVSCNSFCSLLYKRPGC